MESSQVMSKRKRIEWSLKPIIVIMTICGIPASYTTHRFFKFLFHGIVILSLSINIHSNTYSIKSTSEDRIEMYSKMLNGENIWNKAEIDNSEMLLRKLIDLFSDCLECSQLTTT